MLPPAAYYALLERSCRRAGRALDAAGLGPAHGSGPISRPEPPRRDRRCSLLEGLYREDRLVAGTLDVGGRRVGLAGLRAPVLAVVNTPGRVVPPASVLDGLACAPRDVPRLVLRYEGERGPALRHLGPLVGPAAHERLWPDILDWAAGR